MKKLFPILLILATIFNTQSLKAGASFSINDSTFQEVIEFTHPNKKLKKDLFFKVGDEVIIKTKYSPKLIKAKIEGFTKDGIIVKGQTIPIEHIETIRRKSIASFIFGGFSSAFVFSGGAAMIVLGAILNGLNSNFDREPSIVRQMMYLLAIVGVSLLLLAVSVVFLIGLILGLTGIATKYNNKFFNLKKWRAKITTKKLPVKSK